MREGFFLTPPPEIFSGGGDSGQTSTATTVTAAYSSGNYNYSGNNWAAEWDGKAPAAGGFLKNDDVDTTLRLCPPGTSISINHKESSIHIHDPIIYDPTPLRWCPPALHSHSPPPPHDDDDELNNKMKKKKKKKLEKYAGKSPTSAAGDDDQHHMKINKRKSREHDAEASTLSSSSSSSSSSSCSKKKKICRNKGSSYNDEDQRPLVPIEEIAGLKRMVESSEAAVFLYKKTLQESDVKKNQHRLLITRRHRQRVLDFLEAEEAAAAVHAKEGLHGIIGVDSRGNVYGSLVLKRWPSSDAMVINSGWNDMIAANNAQKGDVVEIWGYKQQQQQQHNDNEGNNCNHKSALAFHFRKHAPQDC